MKTSFCIVLSLRTSTGYEYFGRFYIGEDKYFAHSLFNKLKGTDEVTEKSVLQMDLMETRENLPLNINMRGCTLPELTENCRIITMEIFRHYNLLP